jgi:uncharacterized protein
MSRGVACRPAPCGLGVCWRGGSLKNGFRIIDTDTHVGPSVDVLKKYASAGLLERWPELAPFEIKVRDGYMLSISPIPYRREMRHKGEAEAGEKAGRPPLARAITTLMPEPAQPGVGNENAQGRLDDMDREGRDIDLIIGGTWSTAVSKIDQSLAVELYAAYHRYLAAYCSADPSRLKASVLAPASDPGWAARELKALGQEPWVAAVTVILPEGVPVDDPDLDPIWKVISDFDLPLLHHSFFYEPPYFPGYRDIWGHVAIARSAAHIWGAERLLAYCLMSGLFDEYPLRIGFAECSAGWLGSWLVRLEGQAQYLGRSLPGLKHRPRDYVTEGRVFCGVEPYEGEETVRSLMEIIGDDGLMYQSDYPHDQCRFPVTPDIFLGWDLPEATMRKLLAGNAERYLRLA